jgi:hypothetical protein
MKWAAWRASFSLAAAISARSRWMVALCSSD